MCTYLAHLRICRACGVEDTVLISEQMCAGAEASGRQFGSCLEGVSNQHERTPYKCWKCRDAVAIRMRAIHDMCAPAPAPSHPSPAGSGASSSRRKSRSSTSSSGSSSGSGRVRW
ncbi:hypothetical protein V8F20_001777 [Naviculisporaceae sp. PSN 640]